MGDSKHNESIHLVGFIGFTVLAAIKFAPGSLTALGLAVALGLNLILGLWPVVLQRYNRLRLYRATYTRNSCNIADRQQSTPRQRYQVPLLSVADVTRHLHQLRGHWRGFNADVSRATSARAPTFAMNSISDEHGTLLHGTA